MKDCIGVGVIGLGLIGARRLETADTDNRTNIVSICDSSNQLAKKYSEKYSCEYTTDWHKVVNNNKVKIIVVATPNSLLVPIAISALREGKHVLIEKPMGRNLAEANELLNVVKKSKGVLKIGFNHRYHPAIEKAKDIIDNGEIGRIINIRAMYGHGARPGYENEWRGDPELSGGGELTDQGVHIVDLLNMYKGRPDQAFSLLQTSVWPISPLEDNAFGLFKYEDGVIASLHTSWTQWKNKFLFEIYCDSGSVTIDGIGGSYGVETLIVAKRKPQGGVPLIEVEKFDAPDNSWTREWDEYINACSGRNLNYHGKPIDGYIAMEMIDALYRSNASSKMVVI